MPDARTILSKGGPVIIVSNLAGAATITVRDSTTATIGTIAAGYVGVLLLLDNRTAAGTWALRSLPRLGSSTAITLRKLAVAGGTGALKSVDVYNQAANTWSSSTPLAQNKLEGASGTMGRRHPFVGYYPKTGGISDVVEDLDESGTWATRTSAPAQLARTQGASIGGAFYVFSGDASYAAYRYLGDAWTTLGAFPIAKPRGTAQGVNGHAYILAGEPVPCPSLAYSAAWDTYWTIATYPSAQRRSFASFAVREKVYAAGGYSDTGPTRYAKVDEYDLTTDTWSNVADLSMGARYNGAGCGTDGRGYYACGRDNADAQSALCAYYSGGTWVSITNAATSRSEVSNLAQAF